MLAVRGRPLPEEASRSTIMASWSVWLLCCGVVGGVEGNPDAKRLYDDLMSGYNRLIRPVVNNSDTLTVKLGLKLSQLIDVVSTSFIYL